MIKKFVHYFTFLIIKQRKKMFSLFFSFSVLILSSSNSAMFSHVVSSPSCSRFSYLSNQDEYNEYINTKCKDMNNEACLQNYKRLSSFICTEKDDINDKLKKVSKDTEFLFITLLNPNVAKSEIDLSKLPKKMNVQITDSEKYFGADLSNKFVNLKDKNEKDDDSEKQYQFALRAHKRNLELIQNLANKRLDTELDRFRTALNTEVTEYENNKKKMNDEFNSHLSEVRDIKNAIEHEYAHKRDDIELKFKTEKDSLSMKHQEAVSALRTHVSDEVKKVLERQQFESTQYKDRTYDKLQSFQQLYEKNKKNQATMKKNETLFCIYISQAFIYERLLKDILIII